VSLLTYCTVPLMALKITERSVSSRLVYAVYVQHTLLERTARYGKITCGQAFTFRTKCVGALPLAVPAFMLVYRNCFHCRECIRR